MKISCIDRQLQEVLNSKYYKIPRFQRPYSWDRENVEDFWNDAVVEREGDYFIGSMVVFNMSDDTYGVVDGQQRLTTITMLSCVLRDTFMKECLEDLAKGVHSLIERTDLSNKSKYVLQTETSYPYLQEYIQKFSEPEIDYEAKEEEITLSKAYSQLQTMVKKMIESVRNDTTLKPEQVPETIKRKLSEIRDRILQLKLIFVDLEKEDDAYIIFETLNTRGKDLRVSDLVKNHLTKLLPTNNQAVDITKDKWNRAREIIENSQIDLDMDNFLHHYWLSKNDFTTQKKLFKLLKKRIKKVNAKEFLDEILESAKLYRGLQETSYRDWNKQESDLRNSFEAISLFRVKQPIPMLLSVMTEYERGNLKRKHVMDIICAIEHFHFIFTAVTSQRSSGGISLMYAYHARNLLAATTIDEKLNEIKELKQKLRDKLPSRSEFVANMYEVWFSKKFTKQRKLVHYILSKVDSHYNSDSGVKANYTEMTIEHILPQSKIENGY